MSPRFPQSASALPRKDDSLTMDDVQRSASAAVGKSNVIRFDAMDPRYNYFMIVERDGVNLPATVEGDSSTATVLKTRYYFIDSNKYGIVWRNVVMFFFLHIIYLYGLYHLFAARLWYSWMFGYWYGILGLVGITCGAHRLWSHRSYKARLPLRIFLMLCQSLAGQNDLYTWCRDHRLHHKFSESDADPHNSKRGFFFCHVGWLLTRKHPDVIIKGNSVDCTDILNDPVVHFQRKFYPLFYAFFCFLLPTLVCHYVIGDSWFSSFITGSFGRYIVTLHSTWFVNSAAHMWGDRPYNGKIQPRENMWVSYATWGEGFHNYHHVFPWDYTISEMGWKFNPMKHFIEVMGACGLAYDLRRPSKDIVEKTKNRLIDHQPSF